MNKFPSLRSTDEPIKRLIRIALIEHIISEEFEDSKYLSELTMNTIQEGRKKTGTKLCARGKAAAKSKYKVWPSAYANGYAVQVCQGKKPDANGVKRCSNPYC